MPRKKKPPTVSAGVFRPEIPSDAQEVVRLYAIAARAACAKPDAVTEIGDRIGFVTGSLIPPESMAAEECWRLWESFARVVDSPKDALRVEAGKALYRDLDSLGQRLDLPPLSRWEELPEGVDAPNAPEPSAAKRPGSDLDVVRAHAKQRVKKVGKDGRLPGVEVALLLAELDEKARVETFQKMVGEGSFGRTECNMLAQVLARGVTITEEDEALIEVLDRMGAWLLAE